MYKDYGEKGKKVFCFWKNTAGCCRLAKKQSRCTPITGKLLEMSAILNTPIFKVLEMSISTDGYILYRTSKDCIPNTDEASVMYI